MIQSQISHMEGQLCDFDFLDESGRPNPLLAAIDKAKNTARSLAISLQITPLGRKGVVVVEKVTADETVWNNVLK